MRTRILGMLVIFAGTAAFVPGTAVAADDGVPTFTKDVAPIFQAKCEACHRANSIAPMSLVTYQESRPWARSIRDRVSTRQMPPWHIDRTVGISEFTNDRSLTDAELDTVVRWVDGGAPRGNPADMPPPIEWPDESKWYFAELFGPPDLVIGSEPYTMPAEANDAWWKPVSEDRSDRAALGAGDRAPSRHDGRPPDHPPRNRPARAGGNRSAAAERRGHRLRRSAEQLRTLHGMGGRQAGRADASGQRQADAARLADRLGRPLFGRRRGDHRPRRARHLLLPAGRGARAPAGAAPDGGRRRRHPAEHHLGHRRVLSAEARRPHRELPAAHAPARQGDGDGGHPADRPAAGAEPRRRLQLQLAQHLRLRRRSCPPAAEGHAHQDHRVARQHGGQPGESGPERLGRLRGPDGRRDGSCMGQRHLLHRRGLRGGDRGRARR